jgi:hypothetical protein
MRENSLPTPSILSDEFLSRLVVELDDNTVRAIILRGSYARGDAVFPYSDIDLTRIVQETAEYHLPKYYIWRNGYAVSVSTHSYAAYRERFTRPQEAIFTVTGIQEAHVLLDKDGAFRTFQQEAMTFEWKPLQAAANRYAGQQMMELCETILRILRVLRHPDALLLSQQLTGTLATITMVMAVQRGLLLKGITHFYQVQEALGRNSAWTRYHMHAAGSESEPGSTLQERGIATLRLYQETAQLLHPHIQPEHWNAIEPLLSIIDKELAMK